MDKTYNILIENELILSTTKKSTMIEFLLEDFEIEIEIEIKTFVGGMCDKSHVIKTNFNPVEEDYFICRDDISYIKENF